MNVSCGCGLGHPTLKLRNKEKSCPACKKNMLPLLYALPRNILERVACTLIVLTAGLCWAYVLGEVCAIVSDAWPEV